MDISVMTMTRDVFVFDDNVQLTIIGKKIVFVKCGRKMPVRLKDGRFYYFRICLNKAREDIG